MATPAHGGAKRIARDSPLFGARFPWTLLDRPESYFWLSYERFYTFCFHRRAWLSSVSRAATH